MVLDKDKRLSEVTRLLGNVFANIDFTDWLDYRFQVGIDNLMNNGLRFDNKIHGEGKLSDGIIRQSNLNLFRWNTQNILTFKKNFNDHDFKLSLINEVQKEDRKFFTGGGTGLADDFFNSNLISNSFKTPTSSGNRSENGLISYAGRLNYDFNKKYFFQGSLRYDGISRLPSKNRWGLFPSLSIGWNVAKESFFENDLVSEFKIRASWATTGNTDIGNYPYLGSFGNAKYADGVGLSFSQSGNEDLKWETSLKKDIGFDLSMLNNKLGVNFDYYIDDVDNLILKRKYPPIAGLPDNEISENIGRVLNSGFEVGVNAKLISKENFSWNINANITTVDSRVKALASEDDLFISNERVNRIDESINSLYGYKYYGVNKINGNPVYYKADGTLVETNLTTKKYTVFNPENPSDNSKESTLSINDRQILGRSVPKFFGGITNSFTIGNFDISSLIRYSYGNKIMNLTRRNLLTTGFANNSKEILGRWQSPSNPGDGQTPRIIALSDELTYQAPSGSSRFIEDGSFIKFDNLSVGYSINPDSINNFGLRKFRIFVQAQNFWVITNYSGSDPELHDRGVDLNTAPRQRSFTIGFNASF